METQCEREEIKKERHGQRSQRVIRELLIERVEYFRFSLSQQDCTSYLSKHNIAQLAIIACGDAESMPAEYFDTRYRHLPRLTYFTYHLYFPDCIHYYICVLHTNMPARRLSAGLSEAKRVQITIAGGNAPTIENYRKCERDDPLRASAKRICACSRGVAVRNGRQKARSARHSAPAEIPFPIAAAIRAACARQPRLRTETGTPPFAPRLQLHAGTLPTFVQSGGNSRGSPCCADNPRSGIPERATFPRKVRCDTGSLSFSPHL